MRTLLILTTATLAAVGCGSGDHHRPVAPAPASAPARPAALPQGEALARLVAASFRVGLRDLSIREGVSGEDNDIGQPVATGLVDAATCTSAHRCTVRWSDIDGRRHTTHYLVSPANEGCFDAQAAPALPSIRDVTAGGITEHPLSELAGAGPC
ncbi:MAG: hypothetical protein QOF76_3894 [Solirubrobacteraceae bacterium]|jgi:hypothetical protein|nr:hypothetical protein [Solirubrobacteraceae bacterium]